MAWPLVGGLRVNIGELHFLGRIIPIMDEMPPTDLKRKKSPYVPIPPDKRWTHEDRIKGLEVRRKNKERRENAWQVMETESYDPMRELIKTSMDPDTGQRVKAQIDMELLSYVYTKPKDKLQADASKDALQDLARIVSSAGRPLPPTAQDAIHIEAHIVPPEEDEE